MKNTKRFLSIALLILALGLTACSGSGGTTAPTNGGDTTAAAQSSEPTATQPPSPTPAPSEDAETLSTAPGDTNNPLPLKLQIIDPQNGIFCLNDPELKENYPIENNNFEDFEELYQWSVYLYGGNDERVHMGVSFSNRLDYTGDETTHSFNAEENLIARYIVGEGKSTFNAFPLTVQTEGSNLYFHFTLPEGCGFDLTTAERVSYNILALPDDRDIYSGIKEGEEFDTIFVDDVGTDFAADILAAFEPSQSADDSEPTPFPASDAADISELVFNEEAISLIAQVNADGTVTYTYNDTSIKPAYVLDGEAVYNIDITGRTAADDEIITHTGFNVISQPQDDGMWLLDMSGLTSRDGTAGDAISATIEIDSKGLNITWKSVALDGVNIDDLGLFYVMPSLYINGGLVFDEYVTLGSEVLE